jgi:hypothetical protein
LLVFYPNLYQTKYIQLFAGLETLAIAKIIEIKLSKGVKKIKDEPVDMDYEVLLWN